MLRTNDLTLTIGTRKLIKRLDWHVNAGECWCIIGRNGAGKTTLLRTLAGLIDIDLNWGEIWLDNQPLAQWSLNELAKMRSYLPQGRHDAFAYRVIEIVLGARHPFNDGCYWESSDDIAMAHAALVELDVADLAERDARSLSGGERQRVAIAATLAQDAQLMLLDEPTTALDLPHQVSAMQLFSKRCKEKNKTIIMASHDLNLAYGIATHALLLMSDGSWEAGLASQTMTEESLSRCLGHPIDIIQRDEQRIFLPKR